jgi:hypothetical protein
MAKAIKVIPKKGRGRPATGRDPVIPVRMPAGLIAQVEAWAKKQASSRSEAIRQLIEQGLAKLRNP